MKDTDMIFPLVHHHSPTVWSRRFVEVGNFLRFFFNASLLQVYIFFAKMASHAFYISIANVHERDADSAR